MTYRRAARTFLMALLALLASGCATFRSYDQQLSGSLSRAEVGDLDGAIRALGRKGKDSDMLYQMELGELLRLKHDIDASEQAWMKADASVLAWENTARLSLKKWLPNAAAFLVNDKVRAYEGEDYEKVMLSTRMALNHLAQGDFAQARVAIKRSHEREALIAELRAKEFEEIQSQAKKKGANISLKDLGGYPAETIDNPEVNALRNSYQSAFGHYLAGFVYEALGEPSLAAAGYRNAIELRPDLPVLEEGLAGLDRRSSGMGQDETDVLFVIESGVVAGRRSQQFTLPLLSSSHWLYVPMSFPVMDSAFSAPPPTELRFSDGEALPVYTVTDLDLMARRALKDAMPGIMLRSVARATLKGVAQAQASRDDKAALAFVAVALAGILTESADERGWRTLPRHISVARARLPRGKHSVSLQTPRGTRSVPLRVAGSHMVVALRLLADNLYVLTPDSPPAQLKTDSAGPLSNAMLRRAL